MEIKNKPKLAIVVSLAILGLVGTHYLGVLRPIENLAVITLKPLQKVVYQTASFISTSYHDMQTRLELASRVRELEATVTQNLVEEKTLRLLEDENSYLRQELSFVKKNNFDVRLCDVIGSETGDISNDLIINCGTRDGLAVGYPVTVSESVVVGKISRVYDYHAFVRLINDHRSQLAVSLTNSSKTLGVSEGDYVLGVKIDLIPQTEIINIGDLVITSGLETNVPRGLVLGSVAQVFGSDEDVFKSASVKLPVDFNKIFLISVIIPKIDVN
jgi:rod shape-determining protein MreC